MIPLSFACVCMGVRYHQRLAQAAPPVAASARPGPPYPQANRAGAEGQTPSVYDYLSYSIAPGDRSKGLLEPLAWHAVQQTCQVSPQSEG